jgi:hypothetical protein
LAKLCQETSGKWAQLLPIALLRIRNTPRAKIHLSPFEMLYGKPFLSNDLGTNPETKYIMDLGTFQQAIQKLRNKDPPAPIKGGNLQKELGE